MLGLVGAWLVAAGAAVAAIAPAPPAIQLEADGGAISLNERSRWWLDGTAQAPVESVEAAGESLPWALRLPGQQYSIDGKAWWLQFDVQARQPGRWFLELTSSGLDRAQLFYRDARGQWVAREAGDTRRVSDWPLPGRVPTFELAEEPGRVVRYWLRVEHSRVDFAVPITLYPQGQLIAAREIEQFMLGAYFGLAVLLTLVSAGNAIAFRDRSFATYSVYVAALALGQAAYLGVGAQHLWVGALNWNEVSTFLLPGLSSAAGLWFVRTVTEPARFSRALDLMVWALIAALLSAVALDTWMASRPTFALQLALTSVALVLVVVLIAIVWWHGHDPHIRLIALGFLPVVVMAVFPVMRGLNLIPNSVLTRYGITIGAMIEMPILFYAISLRGSRRREAEVRAAALTSSDALTGLANTRVLLQRLDAAIARARSLKHPCALLGVRLANHEAIEHQFGAEALDKALVVAASHLRRAITDIDVAARVGESDFAVLLEGPTTPSTALSRAQHIVASGLRQATPLPAGLVLRFHVAIAMLPDPVLGTGESLQSLVEAAAAIPADARKAIKPLNF
ncbi:MAG: diguanylate cyclase [Burkholderiales bacterium]|nr:diguanylate cyclase [Burkholderiales bacterium]